MFNTKHYLRSKGHFKPAQLQRKFYTETAETDFKQNLTTTQNLSTSNNLKTTLSYQTNIE